MNTSHIKFSIVALTYLGKVVYIGYTSSDIIKYRNTLRTQIANKSPRISEKLQNLNVLTNKIEIKLLENSFSESVPARVMARIASHDTINSGWNTEAEITLAEVLGHVR